MKKLFVLLAAALIAQPAFAQPDKPLVVGVAPIVAAGIIYLVLLWPLLRLLSRFEHRQIAVR